MTPLEIRPRPEFRTVDEGRIIDQLILWGYAYEARDGREDEARNAVRDALERWLGLGLGFGRSAFGGRAYDPAEVMNFFIGAGHRGDDDFWSQRYVATARRLVRDVHAEASAAAPPPSPDSLGPRRFHVRLERHYDLARLTAGSRARLRLPLPLADRALGELEFETSAPGGALSTISAGRLDARLMIGEPKLATLAMEATFTALATIPEPEPLTPADHGLYTRPKEGLICVSPRVRAVADDLAGARTDPWMQALAFYDFLLDRFICGVVRYHEISAAAPSDWPLETGWYDCQLGAALFCALCRARGLPARMISGYQLYPAICAHHYWAEVWIEERGWVPFDLSTWNLSMGGRDEPWRSVFAGALDYRMKVQVLPEIFTGLGTRRFPPAWHMVTRLQPVGMEIAFEGARDGELTYRDRFAVFDLPI